jgi:putative copper resistance protein D
MSVDVLSALVRGASFVAMFQAAGVAIFVALFRRHLPTASLLVRRIGFASAGIGIVLVSIHYGLEAARMSGELAGAFDSSLQRLVLHSAASVAWILRIVGLAMIAASVRSEDKVATIFGLIGAMAIIRGFLQVGHTASDADHGWLSVLLSVHLAVVAFWFGGLLPLYIAAQKEGASVASELVAEFSHIALWMVPLVFIAGVLMMLGLIDRWSVFGDGYGLLVLAKIVGFAVLMWLAALNKWRYGPLLATSPSAGIAFRRTVAVEYVLICVVLLATAFMTTFFSPE